MQRKRPLRPRADIETRLWARLRALNLQGYRFRRRAPFRSFILPFAEHERLLVIDIRDGEPGRAPSPSIVRDRLLAEAGYTVLRFWRGEANVPAMMDAIRQALEDRAPPDSC
jgi:very-short-patch-repair endonuclease